jgi:subtilisin family serine protease
LKTAATAVVRFADRLALSGAALLFAITLAGSAVHAAPASRQPRIEPAVSEAVALGGTTRVQIVLAGHRSLPPQATAAAERAHLQSVAAAQASFRKASPARGLAIVREFDWAYGLVADVDAEGIEGLRAMPQVEYVYLDGEVHASLTQGVPLIGGDTVHLAGTTGTGITVAILDTGINWNHAALGGCFGAGCKVVAGFDYHNNDADPIDDEGHGTAVSGIVASTGAGAVDVGVAPDADLVALKVLGSTGGGSFSSIDSALNWVITNRATYNIKAANLSLGDGGQYNNSGSALCDTSNTANLIASLVNVGVAVVVASGNEGHDAGVSFPACVAEATAVGGVYDANVGSVSWCGNSSCSTILCTDNPTFADKFVCHTNAGLPLDVLAPDYNTTTTSIGGGTTSFGGTSAAAPFVAGAFALMFDAVPSADVATVEANFKSTGVLVTNPGNATAYPRIDVAAALQSFDADLDGLADGLDNCPNTYNPGQEDGDGDGTGEACDNCPGIFNDTQADADGDPSGDACDCDSGNSAVYIGAPQICDGVNNDCADPAYPSLATESDDDSDGQAECAGDCDDANPARFLGNPEICDGIDNDCSGTVPVNENDLDMDGARVCSGDCDDANPARFAGNPEICDGIDNDCNLLVPSNENDTDSDGFKGCEGDCDDTNPVRFPGNPEICDGIDNDCDLVTPASEANADGDGFRICQGDCDDSSPAVFPGAIEICDGFNNDCNEPSWPSLAIESDDDSDGFAECAGDCDDANPAVKPGVPDSCDGFDNDCDGLTDSGFAFIITPSHHDTLEEPGGASLNRYGTSVAPLQDINADGVADFAVGARGWPSGSATNGSVRFISGTDSASIMLSTDPAGTSPAEMGAALVSPGDVDGDGVADLLGGAPKQLIKVGSILQGRVVMFSGLTGAKIWSFDDQALASGASLGTSVSVIRDLGSDGVKEVVVGVSKDCTIDTDCGGSAKILDGATGALVRTLRDSADTRDETFGSALATIDDADGDGDDEIAVSAPLKDLSGKNATGEIRLYSTGNGAFTRAFADSLADPNDRLGQAIASIQDLDGDGVRDLLAGAPGRDTAAGTNAGQVLIFSTATGSLIRRLEDPSGGAGDGFGSSVAAIPDLTKDLVEEIIVGSPGALASGQAGAGRVLLFDGATGDFLASMEHTAPGPGDGLGSCVTALPPLDGDGLAEIAACAPADDATAGSDSGSVVIFSPSFEGDCDADGTGNSTDACTDGDGDGAGTGLFIPPSCPLDCDDGSSDTYPGAPQVCDSANNDCLDAAYPSVPSDECFGIPDLTASPVAGEVLLDWTVPGGGADLYRIYRGTRSDLEAGISGGFCFMTTTASTIQFPDPVPMGTITYYVVAGLRGTVEGSRGTDFFGAERIRGDVCP